MKWTSLPLSWGSKRDGIIAQCDVRPTPYGRVFAKVLMFKSLRCLRDFWRKRLGVSIARSQACVNQLSSWTVFLDGTGTVRARKIRSFDRRYFCVMGFALRHLDMEIICHECVHAGFAYEKRVKRRPWAEVGELDEERVAYPAGILARAINWWCYQHEFYGVK